MLIFQQKVRPRRVASTALTPANRKGLYLHAMAHQVSSHLRVAAHEYDAAVRRFIPAYDEMIARAAAEVAATKPARVLDVGAGTGALANALLRHAEVGFVELLDVDPAMLAGARRRLAGYADRVGFCEGSYDDPLPTCDAMGAALSLHHVPGIEAKRSLFARAHEALPPGGVLVNADVNMPEDEAASAGLYRQWADHMVASGIDEAQAWRHFDDWSAEDTYLPLETELAALESVGFVARQVWNVGPMNVIVARRE